MAVGEATYSKLKKQIRFYYILIYNLLDLESEQLIDKKSTIP